MGVTEARSTNRRARHGAETDGSIAPLRMGVVADMGTARDQGRNSPCFLPIVLTILYLPSFVHPISTLMLKDLVTFPAMTGAGCHWRMLRPRLAHAVIMSEDGQFCSHHGIDLGELKGVIDDAIAGEATRGASTITMQSVKNLFLWSRPLETVRKVVEVPLAVLLRPRHAEAAHHGSLSQHRPVGTEHLRHRSGRPASFRPLGQEP